MENKEKIILDLCGGTGAWSRPYKDAGYDVRVITLPGYDVCTYVPPENVYGILAAPPCTEFSIAKGNRYRDFASGLEIVNACLQIIWKCRLSGSLKFWALENPVGYLRQFLGVPAYQFEHWEFGDPQLKRTDLWGYFNLPRKTVKVKPEGLTRKYGSRSGSLKRRSVWSVRESKGSPKAGILPISRREEVENAGANNKSRTLQ